MKQIVIFDFCETLVNFQTADAFVDFVREKLNNPELYAREKKSDKLRKSKFISYLNILSLGKLSILKRIKLAQLKGIEMSKLEDIALQFYQERVKPQLIKKTIELLLQYKAEGMEIWLVSGGYGIYLKHFAQEYAVDHLISSNINYKEGKATGSLLGSDCMNNQKVRLFKKKISEITDDYEVVASFSDSKSDIPILRIAKEGYVVAKSKEDWIKKNNFRLLTV